MHKGVVLKRSDDHWYLIHPDVARLGQLSGLWKSALYEGVKSNGASFVLPLTDAHAGRQERTASLREATLRRVTAGSWSNQMLSRTAGSPRRKPARNFSH
jgi:reverse gyrase